MKDFLRHNGIWILIAAVLISAIFGMTSAFLPGGSSLLGNLVGVLASPVQKGAAALTGWVEERYDYAFRYEELLAENQALKEEIARLEQDARDGQEASEENEQLRELLDLREKRRDLSDFEQATVLSRSTTSWESTITLSKGSIHGVEEDDCVITSTGVLVGVVKQVGANWCTAITVIDPELELGGVVFRTDDLGILEGSLTLMKEGKLKLSFLPDTAALVSGDQVLTSGRGGVYPSGLVVGRVEEVVTEVSGIDRYAVIAPTVDLESLSKVFIIKSFDIVE